MGNGGDVWPGKVTSMQSALAQPHACTIPDQELEAGLATIAEGVGSAVAGAATQAVLDALGKTVYADTHINGFDDEPDLGGDGANELGGYHGSCRNRSINQGVLPRGSVTCQPVGLWRWMVLVVDADGV